MAFDPATLAQFTGTEHYYRLNRRCLITDGAKYLADEAGAYWLLDAGASYTIQQAKSEHAINIWRRAILGPRFTTNQEQKMTNSELKLPEKLSTISESVTINFYDNGMMVEINGKDAKGDWLTSKIVVPTVDDLFPMLRQASQLPRS
jgi:hypothetical protein